jgi:aryl-alcohol dehydrogenase-like predicted oxidoreductase
MGIRYFDTARVYKNGQSEKDVGAWVRKYPERRKEMFIVNKDTPTNNPEQLIGMLDDRLEAMGIDYVDLLFVHGLAPKYGKGTDLEAMEWPRSDRLKRVFEQIKASGKARYCGFSCHDKLLVDYLNAAAEGGFVDMIMLKYDPLIQPGDDLDKAIDACYNAGIGLIAMKTMRPFSNAPKNHPALEGTGMTTAQNVLQAVWSDKRISSLCSNIENVQQMEENTAAARQFSQPLSKEVMKALTEVASLSPSPMCPGCPSCNAWAKKTEYAFQDISRYVTYYEQDGNSDARAAFRKLHASERQIGDLDLAQLKEDCRYHVDYPELARRSQLYFA